jgi:hypothetical protein
LFNFSIGKFDAAPFQPNIEFDPAGAFDTRDVPRDHTARMQFEDVQLKAGRREAPAMGVMISVILTCFEKDAERLRE